MNLWAAFRNQGGGVLGIYCLLGWSPRAALIGCIEAGCEGSMLVFGPSPMRLADVAFKANFHPPELVPGANVRMTRLAKRTVLQPARLVATQKADERKLLNVAR